MKFCRWDPRAGLCIFGFAALISAAGCSGDSCFIAISNNGNGSVIVKAGGQPVCPPLQPMSSMSVQAVRMGQCETCSEVTHVYVTVESVELRPVAPDNGQDVVITTKARQIDLIGESTPQVILDNAIVPAKNYVDLRMKFLRIFPENGGALFENQCGGSALNCIVTSDGHSEPLEWVDENTEIEPAILIRGMQSRSLFFPPASVANVRVTFDVQPFYSYHAGSLKIRYRLDGKAEVERQAPSDVTSLP
jgi:hypothetical protein